jgi:cell division septation protein DedD
VTLDIWRGWRGRPSATESSDREWDDSPALTASDQRALDAIRRQLDLEFEYSPVATGSRPELGATAGGGGAGAYGQDASPGRLLSGRARRSAILCARLLVWCALGALVTIVYVKNKDLGPPVARPWRWSGPVAAGPPAISFGEPAPPRADERGPIPGRERAVPVVARPPAARDSAGTAYWVQVGAFKNREEARRLASTLSARPAAFTRRVVIVDSGSPGATLARVRVGPFSNRTDAVATLRQLEARGYRPFVAPARD